MVQHFSKLAAHRSYVLCLYRANLRNIKRFIKPPAFKKKLKATLVGTIKKNKGNLSSWDVYKLLSDMSTLQKLVQGGDTVELSKLAEIPLQENLDSTYHINKLKEANELLNSINGQTETSREVLREKTILDRYIKGQQKMNLLPKVFPKRFKDDKLLKIALHENAIQKMNRIHNTLIRGPPKVLLSYTTCGKSKIWFIRSALNKKKNQSKALTSIILRERTQHQKRIDSIKHCHDNAYWAVHEAQWEDYMNTGLLQKVDITKQLKKLSLRQKKVVDKNVDPINLKYVSNIDKWLDPIRYSLEYMASRGLQRSLHFKKYKTRLLTNKKHIEFYERKSSEMYENKVKRYKMILNALPHVNPFGPGQDLPSILAKNKF